MSVPKAIAILVMQALLFRVNWKEVVVPFASRYILNKLLVKQRAIFRETHAGGLYTSVRCRILSESSTITYVVKLVSDGPLGRLANG